jgi:hypothetical protein
MSFRMKACAVCLELTIQEERRVETPYLKLLHREISMKGYNGHWNNLEDGGGCDSDRRDAEKTGDRRDLAKFIAEAGHGEIQARVRG